VGGTDLDAAIAAAINAPVLLTMDASDKHTASEIFNQAVSVAWLPVWRGVTCRLGSLCCAAGGCCGC
jgi:hypothetical protein